MITKNKSQKNLRIVFSVCYLPLPFHFPFPDKYTSFDTQMNHYEVIVVGDIRASAKLLPTLPLKESDAPLDFCATGLNKHTIYSLC